MKVRVYAAQSVKLEGPVVVAASGVLANLVLVNTIGDSIRGRRTDIHYSSLFL